MLVAHRARCADDPENAIESLSGLAPWVDGVEIDTRRTADGVCVLMHDATVDRTTDGTGLLADLTYHQVVELRQGSAAVPTLAGYLEAVAVGDIVLVLVDLKVDDAGLRTTVADTVAASSVGDQCVLMVRTPAEAQHLREHADAARLGFLGVTAENVEVRISQARRLGVELLLVRYGDDSYLSNRLVIADAHDHGLRAGASTINSEAALRAAREDDCDVVLSDRTAELHPAWWTA